ncbi:glucoside xylosyltransferase 1 isoform X1 [Chiloscyllium plagiosum]|uniref:glucoside xylosyltransferase 1 isoform X1 n=2 Tax=Chiloscyllium plagiosum TaxID=36176 RepID=UPI001CB82AFC|nr:glucoside xylosyltransferase 1 isoform X1 [Chiloscyllium plagiosum]
MRRYLRVVLLCSALAFFVILYVFNEIAKAEDGVRDPPTPDGRGPARGRSRAGGLPPSRCKDVSVSFWNPYWMLPTGVCAVNCFWESAFRHEAKTWNPANSSKKLSSGMHLAVVTCGQRLEETLTMLKSAILFSQKPLHFHIFAEDELHTKFNSTLEIWKTAFHQRFNHTIYPITFPAETAAIWKKLFKPCASQRLFLPLILKEVDSLLYVDTDILFLRPMDDIWAFLEDFNHTQIAGMAPEHEEPRIGWYNRFARHPYYGKTGINSGVMLMNMTRIRKKYFKNDMTSVRLKWEDLLLPLFKKYKLNITWGDQDLLNIIFHQNPESLFIFPCQWNYRPDHCMYGSNCKAAEDEGIFVLHGNRGVYHDGKQPAFRAVYEAIKSYPFGENPTRSLLQPLENELQKTTNTYCGRIHQVFTMQLLKSLRTLQEKISRT